MAPKKAVVVFRVCLPALLLTEVSAPLIELITTLIILMVTVLSRLLIALKRMQKAPWLIPVLCVTVSIATLVSGPLTSRCLKVERTVPWS